MMTLSEREINLAAAKELRERAEACGKMSIKELLIDSAERLEKEVEAAFGENEINVTL